MDKLYITISIYIYIYIYVYIYIYIYIYRVGGRGGRGGGGGAGGGEGSIRGVETSLPDLGAHLWVHTEGPLPPPTMVTLRGGGQWGGD